MPVDVSEALRYLGAENSTDLRKDVLSVASVLEEALVPRYVYRVFPVTQKESSIDLLNGQLQLPGHLAQKILKNCEFAAIMVCTLGVSFDSMLRSWQARDMSRAVILDACGSAYVESGCDMAQSEIAAVSKKKAATTAVMVKISPVSVSACLLQLKGLKTLRLERLCGSASATVGTPRLCAQASSKEAM